MPAHTIAPKHRIYDHFINITNYNNHNARHARGEGVNLMAQAYRGGGGGGRELGRLQPPKIFKWIFSGNKASNIRVKPLDIGASDGKK